MFSDHQIQLWMFTVVSSVAVQDGLEFTSIFASAPKCCSYRCTPPLPVILTLKYSLQSEMLLLFNIIVVMLCFILIFKVVLGLGKWFSGQTPCYTNIKHPAWCTPIIIALGGKAGWIPGFNSLPVQPKRQSPGSPKDCLKN